MIAAASLVFSLAIASTTTPIDSYERDVRVVDAAIGRWDAPRAAQAAERIVHALPDSADARYLLARVRFLEGRYADTVTELDEALRLATDDDVRGRSHEFRAFVTPLAALALRFEVVESEHFRVHFVAGRDRVLVARAIEVLENSYRIIGEEFGVLPDGKIRVEFYPDAESFQQASTLTKGEIETSGTIALCKFNRLMVMSPRLVLRGFPWADTLCHEYVHYVLWKRNGSTIPIWLHEGLAKYEEARWTGGPPSALTPYLQETLKGALTRDEFVTFDEMHPSFAKLPGPHQVTLASAEVLSVVHYLFDTGGREQVNKMLDALRDGADWRSMFEIALERPFDTFWSEWKAHMAVALADVEAAPPAADAVAKIVELRDPMVPPKAAGDEQGPADDGAVEEAPPVAEDDEAPESSGRFVRLGGLLFERGLFRAAAVEYGRALEVEGEGVGSVVLLNRLASTQARAGETAAAVQSYRRSLEFDHEYAPTLTSLGLLHVSRGEAAEAIEFLERAARVNPYDPRIHRALTDLYGSLGRVAERARAENELEILLQN